MTMAKPRMDLSAFVGKLLEEQDGDVLREGIRVLSQALMEAEVAASIGAERHERDGRLRTNIGAVSTLEDAVAAFNPTARVKGKTIVRNRFVHHGRSLA
jgi:hypothetical protein